MTAVSVKVVWKIKKEDFEKRDFDDCKFQLGGFEWYIGHSSYRTHSYKDAHSYKAARFYICWDSRLSSSTTFFNVHLSGSFTLLGLDGKYDAEQKWSAVAHDVVDETLEIDLTFDNSVLSFAEKYLFADGTYHLEFQLTVKDLSVGFGSPNHELLLNDADTGCLQIEGHKIYVSKTYLSTISPYFKTLFFGDFKEKTQEVIVLEEVVLIEFMQFLAHSYTMFSYHRDVYYIEEAMVLADKYLCNSVFISCEQLLEQENEFDLVELKLSNKYRYKFVKVCEKAIETLPVKELKEYLAEILSDPDSEYVRRLITKRLEDEANKRKRVCTKETESTESTAAEQIEQFGELRDEDEGIF